MTVVIRVGTFGDGSARTAAAAATYVGRKEASRVPLQQVD